jgi:hypothetical protein
MERRDFPRVNTEDGLRSLRLTLEVPAAANNAAEAAGGDVKVAPGHAEAQLGPMHAEPRGRSALQVCRRALDLEGVLDTQDQLHISGRAGVMEGRALPLVKAEDGLQGLTLTRKVLAAANNVG